jgi:hypothetical protein
MSSVKMLHHFFNNNFFGQNIVQKLNFLILDGAGSRWSRGSLLSTYVMGTKVRMPLVSLFLSFNA